MKGFNFSITSKTVLNKDTIATIEDAVKDKKLKQFAPNSHFKIPNLLRISSPRMSVKL